MANLVWKYKDENIANLDDLARVAGKKPNEIYGFVYAIKFTNGKYYIGKKNLWYTKELPVLKNGTMRQGHISFVNHIKEHHKTSFEVVMFESDWLEYQGSSKEIANLVPLEKRILELAFSKKRLTYRENYWLFKYDVLENSMFINENIGGRFFRGSLA